ncbi:hypothetical protein [Novosphingobium gossypii]|uniref:hypothetical protein n=1 Tax=Novosphingobium gossypii TaxID=1604774 RepID=UPI003D208EE9
MKLLTYVFAFSAATTICSPTRAEEINEQALSDGCGDLVVVGRVQNGDWTRVDDPEDIIGHGWLEATLKVRKLIAGKLETKSIPVSYYAHTYMREDRDFLFVLGKDENSGWQIKTGRLMSAHPRLKRRCDQMTAVGRNSSVQH